MINILNLFVDRTLEYTFVIVNYFTEYIWKGIYIIMQMGGPPCQCHRW
jgi:hypothetical protein